MRRQVFISSVQKEFVRERKAILSAIDEDATLREYFSIFLFEKHVPATGKSPAEVYLENVKQSKIYIGLFGDQYGTKNDDGISAVEAEFNCAVDSGIPVWAYFDNRKEKPHMKTKNLVKKLGSEVVRHKFSTVAELISKVKQSLYIYLSETGVLKERKPSYLDEVAENRTLKDIDPTLIKNFVDKAKNKDKDSNLTSDVLQVLSNLNGLHDDTPNLTSIFAFGKNPQLDLLTSGAKCVLFKGDGESSKIVDHKVIEGNVFDIIDNSARFAIKSLRERIEYHGGIRNHKILEIPEEVLREAITNAIAHRDYSSNMSVQVYIFNDRVKISNPIKDGTVLPEDIAKSQGVSNPHNPTLSNILYRAGYIENFGTGIKKIFDGCKSAGLKKPKFSPTNGFSVVIQRKDIEDFVPRKYPASTPQVLLDDRPSTVQAPSKHRPSTVQVRKLLLAIEGEMSRSEIQKKLYLDHRGNFRLKYIQPALKDGLIEMTIPGAPTDENQKYRLTEKGEAVLLEIKENKSKK